MRIRRTAHLGLVAFLAACALPAEMADPGSVTPGVLPPPGFGTLRQSEVSIRLQSGDLQLMVTPLDESVTRMTAPDTYRRLSGMATTHRDRAGGSEVSLFLVSFFSEVADARFVPEEVQLVTRGIRVRPTAVVPVTPGWGERRLQQRETEMAVYGFAGDVDLESEITLAYGLDQSSAWATILPRIQAERARAHARAGIGSGAAAGDIEPAGSVGTGPS